MLNLTKDCLDEESSLLISKIVSIKQRPTSKFLNHYYSQKINKEKKRIELFLKLLIIILLAIPSYINTIYFFSLILNFIPNKNCQTDQFSVCNPNLNFLVILMNFFASLNLIFLSFSFFQIFFKVK
jgi:hypothetical protein